MEEASEQGVFFPLILPITHHRAIVKDSEHNDSKSVPPGRSGESGDHGADVRPTSGPRSGQKSRLELVDDSRILGFFG